MKKQIVSMKRGAQKGFTLIELMIVIAIIGVLAAFAIPQFQDYTVRTRVAEGLVLASSAKNLVTDNIVNGNSDLGSSYSLPAPTKNTQSITVSGTTGVITITGTTPAAGGVVLELTPGVWNGATFTPHSTTAISNTDVIGWQCTSSTVTNKNLVPAECR